MIIDGQGLGSDESRVQKEAGGSADMMLLARYVTPVSLRRLSFSCGTN